MFISIIDKNNVKSRIIIKSSYLTKRNPLRLQDTTYQHTHTHTKSTDEAQMCARWHENGIKGGKCKGINRARARGAKMSQTGHFERIMTVIIRTWTELNCLPLPPSGAAGPLPSG